MPLRVEGPDVADKGRRRVKAKRKKPPIPVPSLTIQFENPPPKPRPMQPVGPEPKRKKRPHGGHLPTQFEQMSPEDFINTALGGPFDDGVDRQKIRQQNQWAERRRRDEARAARAEEKAAREARRRAVRSLDAKARKFIGTDKLQHYIATGEGLEPSTSPGDVLRGVGAFVRGVGALGHEYGRKVGRDPLKAVRDVYNVADWYVTKAPDKLLGKYEKGKGYQGGAAAAWDAMSTEEQLDTILGGHSLTNAVLHGQLDPANVGRGMLLAAAVPFPWGKGLPSLATVLIRAGMSAEEARIAIQTGRGIKDALEALKTPVRPVARARAALNEARAAKLVRPLVPEDAKVIASWGGDRARIGDNVVQHARDPEMETLALTHEGGRPRAVAAILQQDGGDIIVSDIASEGKGGGRAMMKEIAREAKDRGVGVKLSADANVEAHAFYEGLGMTKEGKHSFSWTPEQAAEFADTPLPGYVHAPTPRLLEPGEADTLQPTPGLWYHGTSPAMAEEIMASQTLKAGNRRDPMGADAVWLSSSPLHAHQFGDAIIEVPDSYIPAGAERISAFGGMISSPVDISLAPHVPEGQLFDAAALAVPAKKALSPEEAKALNQQRNLEVLDLVVEHLDPAIRQASRDIADDILRRGLKLPPEIADRADLVKAIDRVYAMAQLGEKEGRFWYQNAANVVKQLTAEFNMHPAIVSGEVDPLTEDQVAQLFAIFSQSVDTVTNIGFLKKAVQQFVEHGEVFTGMFPNAQSVEAESVMRGIPWEGRKRSAFYMNIIEDVDPEAFAALPDDLQKLVTVDRWVVRMFAPDLGSDVPNQYYDGMEQIMQEMAERLGWKPKEVQAAAWVTIKGLDLPTTGPRALAGAGDAGEYGMRTIPSLFNVPTEHPSIARNENFRKMAHGIEFEVTNGPGGLGADLTLEQTIAVQKKMEKDVARLAEDTPGITLLGIEHDFGGWAGGVNGYMRATVAGDATAKKRFVTRLAKAFDQELIQAGRASKSKDSVAALVMSSPAFKDPQVRLAFFQRLHEIEPSLGGFMSGEQRGRPAIITHMGTHTLDTSRYLDAVERAAADVNISVTLGKRDYHLMIGSQHGPASFADEAGTLGANYTGDKLAGQIRGRLKKTIERARRGELPTEPLTPKVELQPHIPPSSAEEEYKRFLDGIVRASGKGKNGVTRAQREEAERETLKYANRYPDDPEFDEFWRLREAATQTGAVTEIPPEWGGLNMGGFRREPVPTRTLQLNDKVQQLPAARSAVTRFFIERPADWASTKIASEESHAAALVRRMLPTASSRARVAKAAGRQQIIEASRAQARMFNALHDLPDAGSVEDVAHFWWAQLPEAERNVGGLEKVKALQEGEIQRIVSGDYLDSITSQIEAVKAQLSETRDLRLLNELEDLRVLASDVPDRLDDLTASVAQLTKVIDKAPKYDPKVIAAVRALSEERRGILIGAGRLQPEEAAAREGLVSRALGLETTGEETYIGHRLGKVRGAQPSLLPVSPGLGRPRTPQGVGSMNRQVLMRTGRVRASTHVAAEDWRAAQTYHQALVARDDLAAMGTPFTGRLPEGYMLVNPKGRAIPAHWKKLPKLEELDDEEVKKIADEIQSGFLADADNWEQMVAAAEDAGVKWDELRVVPEDVVKRYYGQFTPFRGGTRAGKAYDAAIDFTAASIVFARVGYIPKNIAQNLIMAMPHQGPFILVNAPRAAEALSDPTIRHFLHAEVGFSGAAHGIGEEMRFGKKLRGLPGGTANLVGKVADDPARFSAFLHEAAAAGVISKYNPHLTPTDRAALLDLFTNPHKRPLLNDIRSRSVEAMADFSRLTPVQRRWARRFLIIPGWLWAGSRYPFHFAGTHPGRSALLAYVLAGEPGADQLGLPQNPPVTHLFAGGLPNYVEGIKIPDSWPLSGGKVFRTSSLSPVSTPYDIALALGGQSPDTAVTYANPLAKALYNVAGRRVEYPGGSYQTGFQESALRNLERLLPNWTFVAQEISPSDNGRYPEDKSRLGRFFRELGVVPVKIISDGEKDDAEWVKEAERLSGQKVPDDVVKLRSVHREYNHQYSALEKEIGAEGGLTPQNRLIALIRTAVALHPERKAQGEAMEERAKLMSDEQAEAAISSGREKMGLSRYDKIQSRLGELKRAAQTHTGMVNGGQHG